MTRRFRELWQKAVLTIQLVKVPRSVTQVSFNTSTGWYMIMTSWSSLGVTNKGLLDVISSLALGAQGKRWVFLLYNAPLQFVWSPHWCHHRRPPEFPQTLAHCLMRNNYPLQTLPCIHPICSKTLHSPILFEKVTNLADIFKQVIFSFRDFYKKFPMVHLPPKHRIRHLLQQVWSVHWGPWCDWMSAPMLNVWPAKEPKQNAPNIVHYRHV